MSDNGAPAADVATPKRKTTMSEERLALLAKAREKAREKRLELGAIAAREKALKEQQLNERIAKLKEAESKHQKKAKHTVRRKVIVESSSSDSSTSSDSSEEEAPRAKKGVQRKVRAAPSSTLANTIVRDELQQRLIRQSMQQAFAHLLPGKVNPYI